MSLITDNTLRALWAQAQANPNSERASVSLWSHLFVKHIFPEEEWVYTSASTPEGEDRQRVGRKLERLGGDGSIAVVFFHEVKAGNASTQEVEDMEHQAFDACMRYLAEEGRDLGFVYAVTTVGTKGRSWSCSRDSTCLSPLFGGEGLGDREAYAELHSTDATLLRGSFKSMRAVPPSQ